MNSLEAGPGYLNATAGVVRLVGHHRRPAYALRRRRLIAWTMAR